MSKEKYDIVVIGAGIVGVSTAIHLQQKGKSVLLLDKSGAAQETSYGNSGIIESSYVLPFTPPSWKNIPTIMAGKFAGARINYPSGLKSIPWILGFYSKSGVEPKKKNGRLLRPLLKNAVEEHKSLMEGTDGLQYITASGRIKLHRSEQSFMAAQLERDAATELGVPFDIIDASDFHEIEPAINPVFFKAVSWTGSARYTNPGKAIAAAAEKFQKDGGEFKTEEVTALSPQHNDAWRIQTKQNSYDAAQIIICTGPWANKLLKPLGHKFPIGLKRGYHQHFKSDDTLSHAIVDADEGYLLSPMENGVRLTTGAEFADIDAPHNPIQIAQALPKARELFSLSAPVEENPWMGSRPCTADSLPIIGESKQHKGLWFNLGHGHSGLTIGPSSGRLLSEMLTGEKTFCAPTPYSPYRF